jgi:peptidyl-prolyl cis-trans isomerase C
MAGYLSCSSIDREDLVIAKVENKEIKIGLFEMVVEGIEDRYLPETNNMEGKKKILEYMIAKEVMVLRAIDLGYQKNEDFRTFQKAFKGPFLVAAITKHHVRDKVTVDEEEVDEYYNKMKKEFVLSQITVLDSLTALNVREEILNGGDFEAAAKKYSMDRAAMNGGDIGPTFIGGLFWWIEEALLDAEKGDITLPVRTSNGFAILKVHDVRTGTSPRDKEYARMRVRAIKEDKMLQKTKREITKKMNFEIYPEVLAIAYSSLPDDVPMKEVFEHRITFSNAPKLDLRDEYKGMILSQYDGNIYTLEDFEYIYENLDLPARPRCEQGREGIVNLLYKKFFNDVLPTYAEEKLKLLEQPEIKKVYDRQMEQFIVTSLYNNIIEKEVQVTNAEIDEFYKNNEDNIVTKEEREYTVVLNADQEIIKKVKKLAEEGENFETLVLNFSESSEKETRKGKIKIHVKNEASISDEIAFALPEKGVISEPFESDRGWVVLKLDKIVKGMKVSKEQALKSITTTLRQEKTDKLFEKKIAEWRKNYSIEIYEENLSKAKLTRTK